MHAVVSGKGQVVIPKAVRDALGIERGSHLQVVIQGEEIVLRPVKHFAAKEWKDYGGIAEGIVDYHMAEKKKEQKREKAGR